VGQQAGAEAVVLGGPRLLVASAEAVWCGLAVVVLGLGTVRLYRTCPSHMQPGMRAALGVSVVMSAVAASGGVRDRAVHFLAQLLIMVAAVDAVFIVVRWIQRRPPNP
jgi:hypothetical protein